MSPQTKNERCLTTNPPTPLFFFKRKRRTFMFGIDFMAVCEEEHIVNAEGVNSIVNMK